MQLAIFLMLLFFLLYHIGLASVYGYFAFSLWSSLTICYERISILLFFILFTGIHICLTPTRFFLKNIQVFDFEYTLIGTLIFISNEIEQDSCMNDNGDTFLQLTEYSFYVFLLLNSCCFLFYILWIFIYIMIRVYRYGESWSQQSILAFNNQDLNANNNHEGLNFHEMNRLKQVKFEENEKDLRNKTCSICLNDFLLGEALLKLPECDHLFHNECIVDWLKMHLICPYCRCDIRLALEKENPLINRIQIEENIEQS